MRRNLLSPIVNERNERLISVEEYSASGFNYKKPVQVSLVIAYHEQGIVLVKNIHKKIWELLGGFLEAGEEASACARRELFEESGLVGSQEVLLGYLDIERQNQVGPPLSCAVFRCVASGTANADKRETSDVSFWNHNSAIEPVSAIDKVLLHGGLAACT